MLRHQPKLKDKMLSGDPKHCNTDLSGLGVASNAYEDIFIFKVLDAVRFFFSSYGLFNDFARKLPGLT